MIYARSLHQVPVPRLIFAFDASHHYKVTRKCLQVVADGVSQSYAELF